MALSEFNTTSFIRQAIRNARKSLSDEKTMLTHIQGMEKEFSYVSSEDGQSSLHMHYPCSEDLLSQDKKIKSFGHRNKEKMNIGAQKLSSNNTTKILGRTIVADNNFHDRKDNSDTDSDMEDQSAALLDCFTDDEFCFLSTSTEKKRMEFRGG
jgi:hypothetical protein